MLAFGALVAASVPLLLGLTSVGAALGALGLVSQIAPNGSSTAPVVVLIGLAVGVDYSLFYIRRERVERRSGATADAALAATSATVGRAILVAGMTVVIGLAGLLFTGFGVFTSMALGAILVVAIAVVGSLTVLPAMLALLGDRIDRGRLWPRRRRRGRRRRDGLAAAGRRRDEPTPDRAGDSLLAARGARGPGALDPDRRARAERRVAEHADPRRRHARSSGPSRDRRTPPIWSSAATASPATGDRAAARRSASEGSRSPAAAGAVAMQVSRDGETALLQIPMPDCSLSVADHQGAGRCASQLEPAVASAIPGARADLTGDYAGNLDFSSRLSQRHAARDRVRARAGVHPAGRDLRFAASWPCR